MKIRVRPANGRVVYLDDRNVLRKVVPAVGTISPGFALQVLANAAASNGVVDARTFSGPEDVRPESMR